MICEICGREKDDHEGLHHPFAPAGQGARVPTPAEVKRAAQGEKSPGAPRAPQVAQPVDLALRAVLLEAGIITPAQLEAADAKVRQGGIIVIVPDAG